MKIEIELSDLEALRKQNNDQLKRINELENKLFSLNEGHMRREAYGFACQTANRYLEAIFKEIGFENNSGMYLTMPCELRYTESEDFWEKNRIEVELSANITSKMREAYVHLLAIPKED